MSLSPSTGMAAIVAFALTFYFAEDVGALMTKTFSGTLFEDPASRLDASCKSKWVAMARNDLALQCYLTQDTQRFCLPEERKHLAWLVGRYQEEQDAFNQAMLGYLVRVQLGMGAASATEKDPLKAMDKAQRKAAEPLATPEFRKAIELKTLRDSEVTAFFGKLYQKGLITRHDLGGSVPEHIEEAFELEEGAKVPKPAACLSAT